MRIRHATKIVNRNEIERIRKSQHDDRFWMTVVSFSGGGFGFVGGFGGSADIFGLGRLLGSLKYVNKNYFWDEFVEFRIKIPVAN